ncbi:hydrogenase maturation protease [Desulfobacula sp.]|uniref:hydrogenase maturation protease n=1 Tax=Desulfobacula sp. TaxID=2593537 RepID=UPI00262C89C2|nr:hydrogenase maturation protease [Desulfobacula sp.]
MTASIICIGNRFVPEDAAGLKVFDRLQKMHHFPYGVTIIEGGLAGLNLLPLLEQGGRVVFVDAVAGFTQPGEIVLLDHQEIMDTPRPDHFNHGTGLAYLLTVLPRVCDGKLPEEIVLVGLEGEPTLQMVEQAAMMSVAIATQGPMEYR